MSIEATDLQINAVCLKLALNGLFVVLSDALQTFEKVDFDEAGLVLVPSVLSDGSELHVCKVKCLAIRSCYLLLLLFLSSCFLFLFLDASSLLGLLYKSLKLLDLPCEDSFGVLSLGLLSKFL